MGVGSIFSSGRSALNAAKTGIQTAGHNMANAATEGFSRQRVHQAAKLPYPGPGGQLVGRGVDVSSVRRVNDEYLERQLQKGSRDLEHMGEKDSMLRQIEDVFNEMEGEGLNRVVTRFFNEFRKLSTNPDSDAVRQSVREASLAVSNDLRRLRGEVNRIADHADSRVSNLVGEVNSLGEQMASLNGQIKQLLVKGGDPNDLQDQRDLTLKKIYEIMDVNVVKDESGGLNLDIPGVGPFVSGPHVQKFSARRTEASGEGKPMNTLDVFTEAAGTGVVTETLRGGKLGALLEVRDVTVGNLMERLDDLAFNLVNSVNSIHRQGVSKTGAKGIDFFDPLTQKERASEFINLSKDVRANPANIATGIEKDSPGDNRIALAISGLQSQKLLNNGQTTMDDWYNGMVSEVGVVAARNREQYNQQTTIVEQLNKMRDRVSGVSIDEETTNLLQYQQAFDASAKVIQVADQMLETILSLKR